MTMATNLLQVTVSPWRKKRKLAALRLHFEKLYVCCMYSQLMYISPCCFSMVPWGCWGARSDRAEKRQETRFDRKALGASHVCSTLSIACPLMSGLARGKAWGQILTREGRCQPHTPIARTDGTVQPQVRIQPTPNTRQPFMFSASFFSLFFFVFYFYFTFKFFFF